jgi:hypothetical protein
MGSLVAAILLLAAIQVSAETGEHYFKKLKSCLRAIKS